MGIWARCRAGQPNARGLVTGYVSDVLIAAAASHTGLTEAGTLSMLLTVEGLLFIGLTVSITLTAASPFGRQIAVAPVALAVGTALCITVVAVAAVLAWTDLFLGAHWPNGLNGRFAAIALLLAIVVPPMIAITLAIGIRRG